MVLHRVPHHSVVAPRGGHSISQAVAMADRVGHGGRSEKEFMELCQFPFYDRWREITLKRGGKYGRDALLKQKEFLS